MIVLVVQTVPDHLHGYLSRYLSEASVGVYVGNVSLRVADAIWDRTCFALKEGNVIMVESDRTRPQGFRIRSQGDNSRQMVTFDDIILFTR